MRLSCLGEGATKARIGPQLEYGSSNGVRISRRHHKTRQTVRHEGGWPWNVTTDHWDTRRHGLGRRKPPTLEDRWHHEQIHRSQEPITLRLIAGESNMLVNSQL